jgi:hypothetical protein
MNNFKFLENINDNLYKCIRDLEKKYKQYGFQFLYVSKKHA